MPLKQPASNKGFSADWFMRGALARIGDTIDRLTGRRWIPSSSLATSGLIERLKLLMESEARVVPGKGTVVPHNIKLKMQWDKFSTDADEALARLETELLAAAADHINDSLYYTYAPLRIEVKRDYFTEGVKLFVGYDAFVGDDDEKEAELNVTVAGLVLPQKQASEESAPGAKGQSFIARFELGGAKSEKQLVIPAGGRVSVGRSGGSGLTLDDASVSKIHAALALNADGILSVADTGSTNGTFINNERISYGKAMEISEGNRVKFGLIEVEFQRVEQPSGLDETGDDTVAVNDRRDYDASTRQSPRSPVANDTVEVIPSNTSVEGGPHSAPLKIETAAGAESIRESDK